MNVAISGSRTFTDSALVERVIARLLERGDFIIIGDAPSGVDKFVHDYFLAHPLNDWRRERADWKRWGGYAGHERNGRMIFDAEMLVAFFSIGEPTPGTFDCVRQALAKSITVYAYHEGDWEGFRLLSKDDRLWTL